MAGMRGVDEGKFSTPTAAEKKALEDFVMAMRDVGVREIAEAESRRKELIAKSQDWRCKY